MFDIIIKTLYNIKRYLLRNERKETKEMFGCFYLNEETEKKVKAAQEWQNRFLEKCRQVDKEIAESKRSRNRR
jgi:vacuolar-type H+-ATPase subunit B/Vma2